MAQQRVPQPVVWLVLCPNCGSASLVGGKRCGNCFTDAVYLTGQDATEAYSAIQAITRLAAGKDAVRALVIHLAQEHLVVLAAK